MATYAPIPGSGPQHHNPLLATVTAASASLSQPLARSRIASLALTILGLAVLSLCVINVAPSFPSFRFFGYDDADDDVLVPDSAMSVSSTGIGLTRIGAPNSRAAHEQALAAADLYRPPYTAYFTDAERPLLAAMQAADAVAEHSPLHALAQYPDSPADPDTPYPLISTLRDAPLARFDELADPKCTRKGHLVHARPRPRPRPTPSPQPKNCPNEDQCLLQITSGGTLTECAKLPYCKVEACGIFNKKCVRVGKASREVFFGDEHAPHPWSSAWSPHPVSDLTRFSAARILAAPQYAQSYVPPADVLVPAASLDGMSYARTPPLAAPVWSGDVCRWDRLELEKFHVATAAKYRIDLSGPPKMTDVFYLVDGSESMAKTIKAMKDTKHKLLDLFGPRENVNYGLGVFRDERGENLGLNVRTPLTDNRRKIRRLIDGMVPGGGRDRDEANLVSLFRVANNTDEIKWRHHSRKYIVLIADWPGHEPSCPKWYRITRTVVGRLLLKKQITVIVVNVGKKDGGADAVPRPYRCRGDGWAPGPGQATSLAKQTFGAAIKLSNPWKMGDVVKQKIHAIPARIMIATKVCDRGLNSTLSTKLPLIVPPGGVRAMSDQIALRRTICDMPDRSFECYFTFFDFGGTIGSLRVRAKKILGCPTFAREEYGPDEQ